jgi:hypothetical protein
LENWSSLRFKFDVTGLLISRRASTFVTSLSCAERSVQGVDQRFIAERLGQEGNRSRAQCLLS